MRLFVLLTIFVATASATSVVCAGPDRHSPIEKYQNAVYYGYTLCSMQFSSAQSILEAKRIGAERYDLPEQAPPDWRDCIVKNKVQIKAYYDAAVKTLKKAPAKAALKEHLVSALTQMDGIIPKPDEIKIDYNRRQSASDQNLKEKWTRFEIEQ